VSHLCPARCFLDIHSSVSNHMPRSISNPTSVRLNSSSYPKICSLSVLCYIPGRGEALPDWVQSLGIPFDKFLFFTPSPSVCSVRSTSIQSYTLPPPWHKPLSFLPDNCSGLPLSFPPEQDPRPLLNLLNPRLEHVTHQLKMVSGFPLPSESSSKSWPPLPTSWTSSLTIHPLYASESPGSHLSLGFPFSWKSPLPPSLSCCPISGSVKCYFLVSPGPS
jgi:hypothetical protein